MLIKEHKKFLNGKHYDRVFRIPKLVKNLKGNGKIFYAKTNIKKQSAWGRFYLIKDQRTTKYQSKSFLINI